MGPTKFPYNRTMVHRSKTNVRHIWLDIIRPQRKTRKKVYFSRLTQIQFWAKFQLSLEYLLLSSCPIGRIALVVQFHLAWNIRIFNITALYEMFEKTNGLFKLMLQHTLNWIVIYGIDSFNPILYPYNFATNSH